MIIATYIVFNYDRLLFFGRDFETVLEYIRTSDFHEYTTFSIYLVQADDNQIGTIGELYCNVSRWGDDTLRIEYPQETEKEK